jgi:hypothetical protein
VTGTIKTPSRQLCGSDATRQLVMEPPMSLARPGAMRARGHQNHGRPKRMYLSLISGRIQGKWTRWSALFRCAGRCNRPGALPAPGRVIVFAARNGTMPRGTYSKGTGEVRFLLGRDGAAALREPRLYTEFQPQPLLRGAQVADADPQALHAFVAEIQARLGKSETGSLKSSHRLRLR